MLTYKYEARDVATGQKVKAAVEAQSEQDAAKLIRKEGLVPLDIHVDASGSTGIGKFFNRVSTKDRVLFSRQISTLINAGLPLIQSLRSVASQTQSKPLKLIANKVITDVEAGNPLSSALAKYPDVFNKVFVSMVAAGETSGTLDTSFERLAIQQEKDAEIVSKVRGAMTYPIIVLIVMFAVLIFMIVKVLPQVQNIYKTIPGAQLPTITQALLGLSGFVTHDWWAALIILAIVVFVANRWSKTKNGKFVIDKAKMRMWPIAPLFMKMYMARFARSATTLIGSGVPLIQVLEITSDAVNNMHIAGSIRAATDKIKGGKSLADAIEKDRNFLPLVPSMLRIGEQSGAIEAMLSKVADYYEKEVDNEIKAISTIIEPVLMVIMGVVALTIVAAILLPIYGLVNQSGFSSIGG